MTAIPPPILLLDVDGCLNSLRPAWPVMRKEKCADVTIRWAPALIARIRGLHESGAVEARWSTTWCGYPVQLAALEVLLGLDLKLAFGDRPWSKTWGEMKLHAALDALTEGHRIIWADDDEVGAARSLYPQIAEAEAEGRALLIQPESRHGLTPEHMDQIETFARAGVEEGAAR